MTASVADSFACRIEDGMVRSSDPGQTLTPLDQCSWVEIAPCGCIDGIITAVSQRAVRTTAEQAMRALATSAAQARKDKAAGFRMLLVTLQDWRQHLLTSFVDCPHDPKWGLS